MGWRVPSDYEFVALAGMEILEVGPPSRRRKIVAIKEYVFMSEADAKAAHKQYGGGSWVKRRKHKTRKVEMAAAKRARAAE